MSETACSPAQRLISHAGSRESYKEASEDLSLYSNLQITQKEVERITRKIGSEVDEWLQKESYKHADKRHIWEAPNRRTGNL